MCHVHHYQWGSKLPSVKMFGSHQHTAACQAARKKGLHQSAGIVRLMLVHLTS
jgi:hypothetical protein